MAGKTKCTNCETPVTLGKDGVIESGVVLCDTCANVVRGLGGFAYDKEEVICTGLDPVHCDDPNCPLHGSGS